MSKPFFSGDNFKIYYREFDNENGAFTFPTTTPVKFDPDEMRKTLNRLLNYEPQAVFLTHFGLVMNVEKLVLELRKCLEQLVEMGLGLTKKGEATAGTIVSRSS
mgnify:CR=1 FL=1